MKTLALFLAIILIVLSLPLSALALSAPVGTVSGESGRFYEEITLSDGTKTGVRYTEMNLSGKYGTGKVLRLAECDLSNTNLSIDVLNCGTYTVSRTTVASASKSHSVNGKTVLAALNGDMWMINENSNSAVTKKVLQTTRGVMIIDSEVWATQEFGMENYKNINSPSTVAAPKNAFGVTDENQPLVGTPVFTVTVTNETKRTAVTADGLNRLPAWNSLVVYNHRINNANYALNDSWEVELYAPDATFTVDGKVTATVKAIYPSGSTTRPAIGENTILLTARGSRMDDISSFKVGDRVSFGLSLVDMLGRTDLWQNVVDAIGGHMQVINDDIQTYASTSSGEYPTSLIGLKDDGTVMFANVNASANKVYKGLRYKDAYDLCRELGYNSVFYFDGGGSSAIVTLKDGTYTQRNYSADGSPRAVINAVAMTWNATPVCEKQGSLAYLTTAEEVAALSPTFMSAGALSKIVDSTNALDTDYLTNEGVLRLGVNTSTIDPYVNFRLSSISEKIDTAKYKCITVKLSTNIDRASNVSVYYTTTAQSAIQHKTVPLSPSSGDIYLTFSMGAEAGWSGELTFLRLDLFEGLTTAPGYYADIEYIAFSQTPREAALLKNGTTPLGSITNYYSYKDCAGEHAYTLFSQNSESDHRKDCESCGYSLLENHTKTTKKINAPTCLEGGYVVFGCRYCHLEIETITLDPMGHSFSDSFTVDTPATETSEGQMSRHCVRCDEVTDVTVIPATGKPGDLNGDGVINNIDSNALKRILSGMISLSDDKKALADLNGDGTVNSLDSRILKSHIAGA